MFSESVLIRTLGGIEWQTFTDNPFCPFPFNIKSVNVPFHVLNKETYRNKEYMTLQWQSPLQKFSFVSEVAAEFNMEKCRKSLLPCFCIEIYWSWRNVTPQQIWANNHKEGGCIVCTSGARIYCQKLCHNKSWCTKETNCWTKTILNLDTWYCVALVAPLFSRSQQLPI